MAFSTWEGEKIWRPGISTSHSYDFHFNTRIPAGATLSVFFLITSEDLNGVVTTHLNDTAQYTNGGGAEAETLDVTESFAVANVPDGAEISLGVDVALSDATVLAMPEARGPIFGPMFVRVQGPFTLDWEVNPYNLPTDHDMKHGITYRGVTGSETVFEPLAEEAPGARYVFSFGDRVIALQDYGDRQSLAWSADGVITEWVQPDSGQIFLLDTQIDPIDDLMAGAHIGGGNFALYRKRSIWRGFETGNVRQAIGVVPWIAGIGTEFRFSVQIVPGGNIFLANDSMVYILTEGGQLTPVGEPIRKEIIEHLTAEDIVADYELVDSLFDSWLQEYWLCIPEDGEEFVTAIWIFDYGLFMREQKIEWRKRPMPNGVRRLAAVTMMPESGLTYS